MGVHFQPQSAADLSDRSASKGRASPVSQAGCLHPDPTDLLLRSSHSTSSWLPATDEPRGDAIWLCGAMPVHLYKRTERLKPGTTAKDAAPCSRELRRLPIWMARGAA